MEATNQHIWRCTSLAPMLLLFTLASTAQTQATSQAVPSGKFAELAARANQASNDNRLEEASALYTKALALRPRWEDGWWSLGTLEYDQDHYAKAADALSKLLDLNPRNGTAHAMLGLCQFELHQFDAALRHLLAAEKFGIVKNEELRNVAIFHLGLLQLRAGNFSSSKETLDQLAKDGVRTNDLVNALGQAALMIRPQYVPAESTDGYRVMNRVGDAALAFSLKDLDRARAIYADLNAEFPQYPNLHLAYGRLLLELHENDGAIAQFKEELERDPKNIHSLLEIAAVWYRVDSQNALPYAERAVKLAPQIPFAHYLLGALRLDLGDAVGAIPELEVARRGLPRAAEIHFALGNAYARTGRKLEAAKARGEFARLSALDAPQFGAPVHGETPSGLKQKELQSIETERPPR